ncbi:MAG: type II toxin-antitoxin system VapC family toxin [Kiritimatiellae bacterium]|nr:type II toxin-antitoxin system VapC family toxin [Kiritimatiellia bacterium]
MYLDSSIIVKLVVREPDSEFYADLVDGQALVGTSELAIAECRSALLRKRSHGDIAPGTCEQAWKRLQLLWSAGGGLRLHPVTRVVLLDATDITERCAAAIGVRTLDAIHLASCQLSKSYPLITNDRTMRRAAETLGIPLGAEPRQG